MYGVVGNLVTDSHRLSPFFPSRSYSYIEIPQFLTGDQFGSKIWEDGHVNRVHFCVVFRMADQTERLVALRVRDPCVTGG
jgi:hypothetical protein